MKIVNLSDDKEIKDAKQEDLAYSLLPHIMRAIYDLGYSTKPGECMNRVCEMAEISVKSQLHQRGDGKPKVMQSVYWGKQYLRNADYVGGKHGQWALTDKAMKNKGRWLETGKWLEFVEEIRNAQKQRSKDLQRAKNLKTGDRERDEQEQLEEAPDDQTASDQKILLTKKEALLALNEAEKEEDQRYNLAENLISVIARELKFLDCKMTPQSHDGGIDLWAYQKTGPFQKEPVAFQMKNQRSPVGLKAVKAFAQVCREKGVRGVFITTSDFDQKVKGWALENYKTFHITLISGEELIQCMNSERIWDLMAYRPGYESFQEFAREA